ncbi:MAG TPA: hypothetical protein DHW64_14725 [Chitinophagaceae bacterium]|nr:hypothetical protein [Chitinophagaceae bacterium]
MRKLYLSRFIGMLCLAVITIVTQAQTIGWNFTTATPSTTTANITASDISRGNNNGTTNELITTTSASSTYPGFSAGGNAGVAARIGALNQAANGSAYFEFTLTPANGYGFNLTGISFGTRSTGTAPQAYTIRSSADNFAADIVVGTISNNSSWSLKTHTGLTFSASTATTFRIYGYNGAGSPAANTTNWRIDDLVLSVNANVPANISTLSSLALSTGSLTPSFASGNFTYSSTVPAAVNNITVTPVATDALANITVNGTPVANGNNSQSITLNTGVNNITIQVTAQDGITVSTYSIQVTREVPGNPLLFANPTNFDFGNQCINTIANASFTVNGTDLDGSAVTVIAPTGFSVATTVNGSYGNSIQLNYAGNTLNTTTVYVRFAPLAVQSYQNSFILSGGGASLSYPVTGNGVNNSASVNTQLISNIGFNNALLAGNITDAGCSPVSAYGFEYSTTNNFANGTGTIISSTNLSGNSFSAALNGLSANTIYYVKAFVTNAGGTAYGPQQSFITTAQPVIMAQQAALAYTQNFDNISSWTNGFTSDNGALNFGPVAVNANGNIPNGTRTTTATNSFSSGSSGGVQRGSAGNLVLLATGGTDNSSAVAVDLLLDFTGVNAGTIGFNWASVNNSTGDRKGSLRVYGSVDGINFTEITAAAVLNITNNVLTNGTISGIALPSNFSNNPNARLRFYYYNGNGGTTGSRPKISIDNLIVRGYTPGDVTAPQVISYNPAQGATGITPSGSIAVTFSETIVPGTGNITLHNTTNGTSQVFSINDPSITIAAETVSLNTNLAAFKSYYVTIDAGALVDLGGNSFAGIAANTWSFTTGAPPTSFNFNDCINNLPGGFTQYSVTGAQVWGCTTFGKTGNAVQINGFVSGAQINEDWLISPAFDLSGFDYPLLSFASRVRFAGPSLKLMVSTNYTGTGDPNLAQWTEINGRFAEPESDVWTTSDQIDLSAYKTASVHIAYVYTSSPTLNAARWTLDDFSITNSATPAAPGVDIRGGNIDFDYVANGQTSTNRTFSVEGYNVSGDITVSAPTGFEISLDGNSFTASLTIPSTDANTRKTIYARFRPVAADQIYTGQVTATITNTNNTVTGISFTGTSLRTLKVVNWNLEWFGSTASGLGPNNKDLQQQNVQTVLNTLKADVYALVEIVDTLRFKAVAEALPGNYEYVVNTYGSYADDVNDPDYAGAQKLGFIYNKDVVKKLSTRPILKASTGNAFNSWASGRFPFLMQAEVTLNGATSVVDFIVIHAKANTGNTADKIEGYERRKAGADELKDSLDAVFPNNRIIILGDMNDDFDKTITTEMAPVTVSSYSSFLNDATNYTPITLPLSLTGNSSTASFPDMIDHVITSSEMSIAYVQNSAKVFRDVLTLINGYASTTSDHFPIITKYDWRYFSKPTISVTDLGFFTNAGVCSTTTTLPTPAVTGFNTIVSITSDAPQSFPVGITKVTWTATDIYGNSSTKEQLITVTDNQKPTIQAPQAVSVVNDNGACYATIASLGTPIVADNCGIASVTNNAPALFPVGTTIVTWTATDIHGNITDTAKQEVTVIDNQPPAVTVTAISIPAQTGRCDAIISITQPDASDNCGIATITGVRSDGLQLTDAFPTGTTTISWTVMDVNGNIRTATQSIQVADNQAPQIACAGNLSFCQSDNNQYTVPVIGVTDNCGIATIAYSISGATTRSGTGGDISGIFNTGVSTVLITVTDINGNNSTCNFTVTVTNPPTAIITTSNPDAFCNQFVLSGNSGSYSYKWYLNNAVVSTGSQLNLGLTNTDGTYSLTITDAAGCSSANSASFTYQKQHLVSNYTILAYEEVKLGESNTVASGSVGVMNRRGEASFDRNSSVAAPGAFVKAPRIDLDGSGINIPTKIYGSATVSLPTMFYNTSNTRNLPSTTVQKNTTVTLSGNYNNITIKENATVTLSGTVFGTIKADKGANIRFTAASVSIEELIVEEGSKTAYSHISFSGGTQIKVSKKVSIGDRVLLNPDNHKVIFYMGDTKCDDEKFQVKGEDVRVNANVYMPNGKLKVTAENKGHGKWNSNTSAIYMTGLFIAEQVESKGGNITWNNNNCIVNTVTVSNNQPAVSSKIITEEKTVTETTGLLNVIVMPNPSRTFFTLKISARTEAPVQLRIIDAAGRSVESRINLNANSTVQVGHRLNPGTYYAELVQGRERKVVQLIKIR